MSSSVFSSRKLERGFWASCLALNLVVFVGQAPGQTESAGRKVSAENQAALTEILHRYPKDGSLWFELGALRAQHGETAAAIAAFQKAARLLQDKRSAYQNIIALELSQKDNAAAIRSCRGALAFYPEDRDVLQNYAFALMDTAQYSDAISPLRRSKQVKPEDIAVRVSLISALVRSNHGLEADAELQELLAKSLLSRAQAVALAREFSREEEDKEARITAGYIARTWPETGANRVPPMQSAMLSETLAHVADLIRSERYNDASQLVAQARQQFPAQPDLEYEAALTDVCLQRFKEALATLMRLEQDGPPSAKVEFLMGGAYEIGGRTAEAESAYREAISLDPNNLVYLRPLSALLQKEGRYADSAPLLRRALAIDPEDSQSLVLMARSLEKQGALDEASLLLQHAARSDPNSRRAHAALAELYFRQKRLSDAEQEQALAAKLEDQRIQQWNIWGTVASRPN